MNKGNKEKIADSKSTGFTQKQAVDRFIVNKIFRQWKLSTFGKICPIHARKLYERKLLLRCLRIWKEEQTSNRKLWKLDIRADYHNRFRIWAKVFKAWKLYMKHKKTKKKKYQKAHLHAEKLLIKHVFDSLRYNVAIERKKLLLRRKAERFYNSFLQRRSWKCWLTIYNNTTLLKHMKNLSLHYWARILQKKMFLTWKNAATNVRNENQRLRQCRIYYEKKKTVRVFEKWREFVNKQKADRRVTEMIQKRCDRNRLRVVYQIWRKSLRTSQAVRKMEERIQYISECRVKRKYLYLMKSYSQQKRLTVEKLDLAYSVYLLNVKKKMFRCLLIFSKYRRKITHLKREADIFHTKQVQSLHFSIWISRFDDKEDSKMKPRMEVAFNYYRTKCCSKFMFCWKQFVKKRRVKHEKFRSAVAHHNKAILPRCFFMWKDYITMQNHIQTMKITADNFQSNVLYAKYFYSWIGNLQRKESNQEMLLVAIRHCEATVLKKYHLAWKHAMETKQIRDSVEKCADEHLKRKALARGFMTWVCRYKERIACEENDDRAIQHHKKKLQKLCFQGFKKHHLVCRRNACKEKQAAKHAEQVMLRKALCVWKLYTQSNVKKNAVAETMKAEKFFILKSWAFEKWQSFVQEEQEERRNVDSAEKWLDSCLKKKSFNSLRLYALWRVEKRLNHDECVIRAQIRLEKGNLSRLFNVWKIRAIDKKRLRCKREVSVQHFERITARKYFQRLRESTIASKRSKALKSVSKKFRVRQLQLKYLLLWKSKNLNALEEKKKSNMALVWWSYQLQRKVFSALKVYRDRSKHKKLDYKNALEFRRQLLVERGLVSWIQHANESIEKRRNFAYKEQLKCCMKIQSRVHKYALHWLRQTQLAKTHRQSEQQSNSNPLENVISRDARETYHNNKESLNSYDYETGLVSARFKPFEINIPKKRTRPSPRRPDYLKDSYDVTSMTSLDYTDDINPRNALCMKNLPILDYQHPLQVSRCSAKVLELSSDDYENLSAAATPHLLPPSSFI